MIYPLVRELAAAGAPVRVPVAVTCRVLKIARAPYYRWLARPVTPAQWLQAHRVNALIDAHRDDPEFGYRLLRDEAEDAGWPMTRRTAWALTSRAGLVSATQRRRRGSGKRPGPPVFNDLVQRVFTANEPNRLWLTDIERHEALLNLAVVKGHRSAPVAAGV